MREGNTDDKEFTKQFDELVKESEAEGGESKYDDIEQASEIDSGELGDGLDGDNNDVPFYVDWIVKYKDESIGLFDTKGGLTAETAGLRATGLAKYIKEQKLEDAVNRRIIRPNKDLQGILSAKPEDEITYFNLQTYINHHFTEK